MKNCFKILLSGIAALFCSGCDSYLDVVPEGVATIDNAFSNRATTQRYLYTCYSYLPNPVSVWDYPACFGGDEMWWDFDQIQDENGIYVAQGYQNANDPYQNYWDGSRGGKQLFQGMRSCNIFLENVHIPRDLNEYEKNRWIAEVKFIKAYLHFFLMQLYGPIPVMRENLPVSASPEEVRTYREPIDDVVSYIVQLIDEAMPYLPMDNNAMRVTEAGRITKPVALAIKARALVWAASPLFNGGNATLAGFKDNRGVVLIPDTPDPLKWERALTAVKNAIDTCHLAGHALYRYTSEMAGMSDTTKLKYALRYAITEKFNPEIVWPDTHNAYSLQVKCMPLCELPNYNNGANEWCATLKIAEQFYT
ncbi:MAG: RagB/SusD family nutrient uptake outer membrane protein, partial [Prevotellaceae bacterium]|nr:RagB/SusD family nutrient uptake outer membrane protein [Prevotellaceae bacterium]